ncbi:MAG TPA: hypothetical protein VIJ42_17845 [Stellaceae bacterium]
MPQFITIHRTPGLKRDDLAQNAANVLDAKIATFRQIYVNIASGLIVSVFEADTKEQVEEQMEVLGFPIDEMHEVHFAQSRDEMAQMLQQYGKR